VSSIAEKAVWDAFVAFDLWVSEHEEVQELDVLDQVAAYSEWCRKQDSDDPTT